MSDDYTLDIFKDHLIYTVHESSLVKRFIFKKPNTGTYGFALTCADNLIAMTGDCYSLFIEPGYGRDGLAFLLGSVKSSSYFLSKVPSCCRDSLKEYKYQYALEDMEAYFKSGYLDEKKWEKFKEDLSHEDGEFANFKYHELCYDMDIEEPPHATRMNPQTKLQMAGLMVFADKYLINSKDVKEPL